MEANQEQNTAAQQVVLDEDQLVDILTNKVVKATEKEQTLQSMIAMMIDEYGFEPDDMERDFKIKYEDPETEKTKTQKVDLAIFEAGRDHDSANVIRVVIVAKNAKVKADDNKNGLHPSLDNLLNYSECKFGCWTNGEDLRYLHSDDNDFGQPETEELTDFPAVDQTLEDLEKAGDRAMPRTPANESLVKTFKRCHDYIYANEGRVKDAFWELLNLIFCKLYDEKCMQDQSQNGESYHRRFWVGVKELNTPEGQHRVAERIKGIFEDLKSSQLFKDVFDGDEQIHLSDSGGAAVASELAKYSFSDATVDVKGTAYETIVGTTLKREQGQFFTPRNEVRCMVEMLDPGEDDRVVDIACGTAGFIVGVLDHVRHKIAKRLYPNLDEVHLKLKLNSPDVNDATRKYAENMLFGFDFDPDLKKAARMNMIMAGDGLSNIFNINSLEYPKGSLPDVPKVAEAVNRSIANSKDKDFPFETSSDNAQGKFDMIFMNPPFGSKVPVAPAIAERYELASTAPEVLFIECAYNFLKPGGKLAIVLPDGILGNPNTEFVREWILHHYKLLASVDMPVETFLPQVGVQSSILFLQKKTAKEQLVPIENEDYDVFMAIVDKVGKDRRGVPIYKKDDDGAEILFKDVKRTIVFAPNGREIERVRVERQRHLDDDLPDVAKAYKKFKEERA